LAESATAADVDVVMTLFEVWGSGGFMGEAARENAEKYFTHDCIYDASALVKAPVYKVYHGIDGFLEFINTLTQVNFVDFVPHVFVTPSGTVLAKNTYKGTLSATGAALGNNADYLEFTLSGGKISYVKFYWGDQLGWEEVWDSETIGVAGKMLQAWGSGAFSGPDKEKAAAEFFTDDFVLDATSNIKGTDAYRVYHGLAGVLQWTHFLAEAFEIQEFVPQFSPGPKFGTVFGFNTYRVVSKKNGKSGTTTDSLVYKITGGKISKIKFYWGDISLLQEMFS
jgi:ketosteroid isomerase-like protein